MPHEIVSVTQSVNSVSITDVNAGVDSFGQLSDTVFTSVGDNELLQFDTSSSKWINQTITEAGIAALAGATFTGALQLNSTLTVGVDDTGYDVKFFGATSGSYMLWDESEDKLLLNEASLQIIDATPNIQLYDSDTTNQFNIDFNGADVTFKAATADGDTIFQADDGSGGLAEYFRIDGGTETIEFSKPINIGVDDTGHDVKFFGDAASKFMHWDASEDELKLPDATKLTFGTGGDLEIYHTGSQSIIRETNTASDLILRGEHVALKSESNDNFIHCDGDGAVNIYYDNSAKLTTSSTGATVTGKLVVSGDLDVDGTTTTFDSTVITVDDPVFGIGGDTAPSASDNKDRGVSFRYFLSGGSAKVGFFGFDNSANAFTFLTETNEDSTEVFSGTVGNLNVGNVLHGDGSAAAPSISFSSDSDTGFYYSGSIIYGAFNTQNRWKISADYIGSADTNAARMSRAVGSAVSPSFTFINDENTGMFRADADQLGFSTGGVERLRIDSAGNFGIGTATPAEKLDVAGVIKFSGGYVLDSAHSLRLDSASGQPVTISVADSEKFRVHSDGNIGIGTTSPSTLLSCETAAEQIADFYSTDAEAYIRIRDNNDSLYVSSDTAVGSFGGNVGSHANNLNISLTSGNVGIGTISPDGLLMIRKDQTAPTKLIISNGGTSNADTSSRLSFYEGTSEKSYIERKRDGSGITKFHTPATDNPIQWTNGAGEYMRFTNSSVGIGTTSPSTVLEVSSSGANGLDISEDAAQANQSGRLFFSNDTSSQGVALMNSVGSLKFQTGAVPNSSSGTTRMTLSSGGLGIVVPITVGVDDTGHDVKFFGATAGAYMLWDESTNYLILGGENTRMGIGMTNPSEVLQVDGNIRCASDRWFRMGSSNFQIGADGDSIAMHIHAGGSERMTLLAGGNLGIGTTSPAALLDIVDSQTLSGSVMSPTVQTTATLTATSSQTGGYKIQDYFNLTGTGGSFTNTAHQQVMTTVSSTGTGTYLKNHMSRVHTSGSGQIHSVAHYNIHTELGGNGTITNWIGYAVADNILSSFENTGHTITNTYGLYIGDLTHGTQTNTPYGVYQASTDMINYFGGAVTVGDVTIDGSTISDAGDLTIDVGGDISLDADGGNVYIKDAGTTIGQFFNSGNDFVVKSEVNDKDLVFKGVDGGANITALTLDMSDAGTAIFGHNVVLPVNGEVDFNSGDVKFRHSSGALTFQGGTFNVGFDDTGYDVKFFGATSGKYMLWDESADALTFPDTTYLYMGNGADLRMYHNGSDSHIDNYTGNLNIVNNTNNGLVQLYCDDGSNSVTPYITLDGDAVVTKFSKPITVGVDDTGHDVKFFGATSGRYVLWDESDDSLVFANNTKAKFGSGGDLQISSDGSNTIIDSFNRASMLFRQHFADGDMYFQCDDGNGNLETYFYLDGSFGSTIPYTIFPDSARLGFGASADLNLHHDATHSYITNETGALYIRNNANDQRIRFQADDGAGGLATYFDMQGGSATHNGSATTMLVTQWYDNSRIFLGDGSDIQIWHDGTNSTIYNAGGDFTIKNVATDKDLIFQCDAGGVAEYFRLDGGREVVNFSRGIEYNVTGISNADYTVTSADYIVHYVTLTGSGKTVTLPTAQCTEGRVLIIKDGAAGAAMYNITIATEGDEDIDGADTKVISSNYGSVTLYADHLGANWFTI